MIGKVVEVFIPGINKMESKRIGFKIDIDDEIMEIIQEQDESNASIYKDDIVEITKQIIDEKEFIGIARIGEEDYE